MPTRVEVRIDNQATAAQPHRPLPLLSARRIPERMAFAGWRFSWFWYTTTSDSPREAPPAANWVRPGLAREWVGPAWISSLFCRDSDRRDSARRAPVATLFRNVLCAPVYRIFLYFMLPSPFMRFWRPPFGVALALCADPVRKSDPGVGHISFFSRIFGWACMTTRPALAGRDVSLAVEEQFILYCRPLFWFLSRQGADETGCGRHSCRALDAHTCGLPFPLTGLTRLCADALPL